MIEKAPLKALGLKDNEISIYLALLELGESLAPRVGEKAGFNRTHTYDIIEKLISMGLASYVIRNNRRYFHATHPGKLQEYLGEQQKVLRENEEAIHQLIPSLLKLQNQKLQDTNVEVYRGVEGIKAIYNDILRSAKEYYILGGTGKVTEVLKYYFPHHERERIKRKILIKVLFNSAQRGSDISSGRKFAKIRFMPDTASPVPTLIYRNRVVILIWTEPLAIVIENADVKETYLKYFKTLWEISEE